MKLAPLEQFLLETFDNLGDRRTNSQAAADFYKAMQKCPSCAMHGVDPRTFLFERSFSYNKDGLRLGRYALSFPKWNDEMIKDNDRLDEIINSKQLAGVAGFKETPAFAPKDFINWMVRWRSFAAST